MFHWRHGWYFTRMPSGDVQVRHVPYEHLGFATPSVDITIPADEWASIVAAVSAGGNSAEVYAAAQDFHRGVLWGKNLEDVVVDKGV